MNGWLLVRIAGIVVGIATLLRVATNEKFVTYDPLFLSWMDWLSDIVELGFLTKLIGPFLHSGIEWVRSLGINVPDLQDEWRPAFVLSMLMFATIARHSRNGLSFFAAPVGALVIAVWSGLVGHFIPVAIAATVATAAYAYATSAYFASFYVVYAILYIANMLIITFIDPAVFVAVGANYVYAIALVAVVAINFLLMGGVERSYKEQKLFANASFNVGIDILSTMSLAFAIAVAAANPPIW